MVDIAEKDPTEHGATVLHAAVKCYCYCSKSESIIKYLVRHGAHININVQDDSGKTPLHEAISQDDIKILEVLLAQGAAIDIPDNNGNTHLHIAAKNKGAELMNALLAKVSQA
ncbi:hypothetical protein GR268_45115 [Rhizobium leguminosarum]|nr:hypothetical protein [Rhizobium leguminosarum]